MTDFENFHILHKALGDYWYLLFGKTEQVGTYIASTAEMYKQISQEMHELINSLSRYDIDIFRTYRNYPIKVKKSDYIEYSEVLPQYNGEYIFDGRIRFDNPVIIKPRIKVPSNIVSVGSIVNTLNNSTIEITDIVIDNGYIELPFDPFTKEFFVEEVDGEDQVTIWLKDVKIDYDDLYTQYGYALDIKLPSSERYKDIINTYTNCLVNGGSKNNILAFIKAVTGAEGEIVVADSDLLGIVLPKNFIGNCIKGDLVLKNEELPLEVKTQDGFTRVELPIVGKDTQTFNDLSFERGKDACVEITDECELSKIYEKTSGVIQAGAG